MNVNILIKKIERLYYEFDGIEIFIEKYLIYLVKTFQVTFFNKYSLGFFYTFIGWYWSIYLDLIQSFGIYYEPVESFYYIELNISQNVNENPNIYYKFTKFCYKYLSLKNLDFLLWDISSELYKFKQIN